MSISSRPLAGSGRALAALAAAAFAVLSCGPGAKEPPTEGTKPDAKSPLAALALAPKPTPPPSLGDLPEAVARLEQLREEVEGALTADDAERKAASELDAALARIGRLREHIEGLPLDELVEVTRRLASTDRSVAATEEVVASRLRRVEDDARQVHEMRQTFETLAELAGQTSAPPAVRLRTGICRSQLDELGTRLTQRRTDILVLVDRLAEARGAVSSMKATTRARLVESRRRYSALSEAPIWKLGLSGREEWAATGQRLVRDAQRIRRWLVASLPRLLLVTVVVFGGTLVLLHRLRPGAERRAASDPAMVASLRFMESPVAAAVPVTVLALMVLSPQAPAIVYEIAWLPAAPAAAWVLSRMLGPAVRRTVWVLAASLALAPLGSATETLPLAGRLVPVLQTAPLAVVLGLRLSSSFLPDQLLAVRAREAMRAVGWLLVLCLGAAAVSGLLGWVGIASILRNGALGTLGGVILIVATYLVLAGLLRQVLASGPARALLMVRSQADVVAQSCVGVLRFLALVVVAAISINAFGFELGFQRALDAILGAKATVGSLTISSRAILGFVFVLWVSALLSRLLSFLLAEEVLPRLDLRRGTAVAISATTRNLVLLAGFVVAAGVAGVDLTTFGFLAGALGVGIGFGLQNIVSNFVSGLILLFERPIQVGDAVEVSGTAGTVVEIGIRASTVRTFDGGDVIVPNADLISKPVTNWTGSSPYRRFDIPVGVAYGSPLETTAQALLTAARRTPGLVPAPAPEAFFQSFGASSLDWTLRVWVKMDESPQVLSELKRAVNEELAKAKLEVPFPQRDLHVRSVAPEARELLLGKAGNAPG